MKIPVFAISIITDLGVLGKIQVVTHEEVQEIGKQAEKKMTLIMEEMMQKL